MRDIKSFLANLSHLPGVYQMLSADGKVLYIGKAKSLKKRITSYFTKQNKDSKTHTLVQQIADIDITITRTESEAVLLECNLIKKHQPRYNVLLRDDKSYPYILITSEHPNPRIDLYRGTHKKKGLYFGPYPSAGSVRETINLLQKLFKIRTCRDSFFATRTRPCLLYQIARCTAPCVEFISAAEYQQSIQLAILFLEGKSRQVSETLQVAMERASNQLNYERAAQLRDQIARLQQIQQRQYVQGAAGDADILGLALQAGVICIQVLSIRNGMLLGSRSYFPKAPQYTDEAEILSGFIKQYYLGKTAATERIPREIIFQQPITDRIILEEVLTTLVNHKVKLSSAVRSERKQWLTMAEQSAHQSLAAHLLAKSNIGERVKAFQTLLGLDEGPIQIECFDISHSMGEATVASCVCFNEEGPVKSHYRRFNIKGITPGDDFAAMRQVLQRRYQSLVKEQARLPDVIMIDGGAGQLTIAEQVMAEIGINTVLLMSVAKGAERKPGLETLHFTQRPPLHLASDSKALHFIQQIRDEAHRFAITGHRQQRDKVRRQSTLEQIPGIGAKRRRDLLRYFGGIQGIARASLDEIAKVPGISRSLAERIFAVFHDATV